MEKGEKVMKRKRGGEKKKGVRGDIYIYIFLKNKTNSYDDRVA